MRVLHLFSDHRWTGPAEPVTNLVRELRRRGVEAGLAVSPGFRGEASATAREARRLGVEPILSMSLHRKDWPLAPFRDLGTLRRLLVEREIDVVHAHLSHCHALASVGARTCGRRVAVVRTNHKGRPLRANTLSRLHFGRLTDAYVGFSPGAAEADGAALGIPRERVLVVEPAVDLAVFDRAKAAPCAKRELGLAEDAPLAGVVARLQPHRRFDVLLRALKRAHAQAPGLRLAVLGRGSRAEEAALRPARELGLEGIALFPGYQKENYVDFVAGFDFLVFLVPGSDGTCRAAREALALGVPVIAARRGMLPEIVEDGVTGLVVDDTEETLAAAMVRLAEDAALRSRLGAAAARRARERWLLEGQAAAHEALFAAIAEGRGAAAKGGAVRRAAQAAGGAAVTFAPLLESLSLL